MLFFLRQKPMIIHRDLKSQNILLATREGVAKIADFGLSRFFKHDVASMTGQVRACSRPDVPADETLILTLTRAILTPCLNLTRTAFLILTRILTLTHSLVTLPLTLTLTSPELTLAAMLTPTLILTLTLTLSIPTPSLKLNLTLSRLT